METLGNVFMTLLDTEKYMAFAWDVRSLVLPFETEWFNSNVSCFWITPCGYGSVRYGFSKPKLCKTAQQSSRFCILLLNWWKRKPSESIACTRKQQPRFYWSCNMTTTKMDNNHLSSQMISYMHQQLLYYFNNLFHMPLNFYRTTNDFSFDSRETQITSVERRET